MAPATPLTKHQIRANKARHRALKHQIQRAQRKAVDVGCVIHGNTYDWCYVDRLYSMVTRNLSVPVTLHVWTEHDRSVPPQYVKHCLEDWPGIAGPKKGWWYKMQMFDPRHHSGDLLYFDLDVVICNGIDWIMDHDTERFWTLRDFRYLQSPGFMRMNSSLMWWNVERMSHVWNRFLEVTPTVAQGRYHGDQDFLQEVIDHEQRRFFPDANFQSWRWSAWQGGMDFRERRYRAPGQPAQIKPGVSVLVFHGHPKPHEVNDPVVRQFWC